MTVIRTRFVDLKLIAYTNGLLLLVLASALGLIGAVTHLSENNYELAFFGAAFTTAFFGGLLVLANRASLRGRISIHTSYLLTFSC